VAPPGSRGTGDAGVTTRSGPADRGVCPCLTGVWPVSGRPSPKVCDQEISYFNRTNIPASASRIAKSFFWSKSFMSICDKMLRDHGTPELGYPGEVSRGHDACRRTAGATSCDCDPVRPGPTWAPAALRRLRDPGQRGHPQHCAACAIRANVGTRSAAPPARSGPTWHRHHGPTRRDIDPRLAPPVCATRRRPARPATNESRHPVRSATRC
jgi:hypothetical protein